MTTRFPRSMKFCIGLSFALSLLTNCHSNDDEQNIQAAKPSGSEEILDLAYHPMDQAQGIIQIQTFKDSILVDSVKTLPITADSIPKDAFNFLAAEALKLKGSFSGNYVLAMRIIYGLNESGTKISLFYQPIFLKRMVLSSRKDSVLFQPKVSPNYYRYEKNAFVYESDTVKIDSARARYIRRISFRKRDGNFRRCYFGTADTCDVMASLFAIQEIREMANENSSAYVYIINSGERIRAKNKTFLKHVMLLGPDSLLHHAKETFYRKYANLSHLCPPNCAQHYFTIK